MQISMELRTAADEEQPTADYSTPFETCYEGNESIDEQQPLMEEIDDESPQVAAAREFAGNDENEAWTSENEAIVITGIKSRIRRYECDVCNQTFSTNRSLLRHEMTHRGIKAYQCDYCSRRFTRKDKRDLHLRLHTGERPYKCHYCNKAYTRNDKLHQHERTSHIGKMNA